MMPVHSGAPWRNLAFATLSFTLSFAAWGLISAFAPTFRAELELSAGATALLVAVPVLLGSVARVPAGLLTDRFGGRIVFPLLFLWIAGAAAVVPSARSYDQLVAYAFLLGLAGSSFAIGVGFVSRWFPPERQGMALGVYGLGNIGQSAAVFLGPVLAGTARLVVILIGGLWLVSKNAPAWQLFALVGAAMAVYGTATAFSMWIVDWRPRKPP